MDFIVSPPKFWRTFSWHFNFHQSAIFQVSLSYFFNFHVDTSWHSACIYWFDGKVNMYDVINNIIIILSYQETWKRETGNRKRAGSIQQQFCFHWTAKRDRSLKPDQWVRINTWSMGAHQHLINGYASTLFNEKKNHRSFFQSVVKQYQNNA